MRSYSSRVLQTKVKVLVFFPVLFWLDVLQKPSTVTTINVPFFLLEGLFTPD